MNLEKPKQSKTKRKKISLNDVPNPKYLPKYKEVKMTTEELKEMKVLKTLLKEQLIDISKDGNEDQIRSMFKQDILTTKLSEIEIERIAIKQANEAVDYLYETKKGNDEYPNDSQFLQSFITDYEGSSDMRWPHYIPNRKEISTYKVQTTEEKCLECDDEVISCMSSDNISPSIYFCDNDHKFVTIDSLKEWQKEIDRIKHATSKEDDASIPSAVKVQVSDTRSHIIIDPTDNDSVVISVPRKKNCDTWRRFGWCCFG